jgi:hypothetical protein
MEARDVATISDIRSSAQANGGLLPRRQRGRPSAAAEREYREQVAAFCRLILKIQSSMDFKVGSRGWCYHGLTWIDNLETSSGEQLDDPDHADHDKRYVQDYIANFGVRKCEANSLVVEPDVGRQLVRAAILAHVPVSVPERYQRKLVRVRKRLQRALRERVA